jgi:hypothetical protein
VSETYEHHVAQAELLLNQAAHMVSGNDNTESARALRAIGHLLLARELRETESQLSGETPGNARTPEADPDPR